MKNLKLMAGLLVVVATAFGALMVSTVHAQTSGGVAASGALNAKITISLGDTTLALGTPDPACEGNTDGTTVGEFTVYNGTSGNQGCAYVWASLTVTVKSNRAWTGDIDGADGTPTSGVSVVNSNFRYDTSAAQTTYAECNTSTALATTTSEWEATGAVGNNIYSFYHCVQLDWDDADGSIDSTITYTVSQ